MQTFVKGKRVGYWLNEKKIKKLNFQVFVDMCRYEKTYTNELK
ncbi:inositol-tetrakisphosphate 1-kinase, partial [Tachysurus ichikawai]